MWWWHRVGAGDALALRAGARVPGRGRRHGRRRGAAGSRGPARAGVRRAERRRLERQRLRRPRHVHRRADRCGRRRHPRRRRHDAGAPDPRGRHPRRRLRGGGRRHPARGRRRREGDQPLLRRPLELPRGRRALAAALAQDVAIVASAGNSTRDGNPVLSTLPRRSAARAAAGATAASASRRARRAAPAPASARSTTPSASPRPARATCCRRTSAVAASSTSAPASACSTPTRGAARWPTTPEPVPAVRAAARIRRRALHPRAGPRASRRRSWPARSRSCAPSAPGSGTTRPCACCRRRRRPTRAGAASSASASCGWRRPCCTRAPGI